MNRRRSHFGEDCHVEFFPGPDYRRRTHCRWPCGFFLFLYLTGHDPDETPLGLMEWIIAGALLGPGFGYLLKWRKNRGR
ncbi:hypothetical protein [Agrobacterium sp. LMR679]|uniref:hypothetical protein n=1 Tax=Agrobacterium sp. LMR679 TaxID=3014335 RepID=UPI0022B02B85|nr:hypothetical protein [Agrobacterium sp. LMR679]MCZ4071533.1 hypothetical protein [Agrobacterium sp. LMR679]